MTRKTSLKLSQFLKDSVQNIAFPDSSQIYWLLRSSCVGRQDSGFVLPVVTLLLVMLGLVVGVVTYRSFERAKQVSGQERQAVLYNAATPAIDRAKLKLEYLFTEDNLPPLPSDVDLVNALSNDSFYTLPDETRIELDGITEDVNNNGVLDTEDKNCNGLLDTGEDTNKNAKIETEDLNGNCTLDTGDNAWVFTDSSGQRVMYSILASANGRDVDLNNDGDYKDKGEYIDRNGNGKWDTGEARSDISLTSSDSLKADNLVARNGPINLTGASTKPGCENVALSPLAGWSPSTSGNLLKAIQVHAVALNDQGNFTTLEMQQDRQASLGNKWAAWFRYDLELFPGPSFQWNGATHSASNYLLASNSNTTRFYLVSSPKSCIYTEDASEITMSEDDNDGNGTSDFQGQLFVGKSNDNKPGSKIQVDLYGETKAEIQQGIIVDAEAERKDSVKSTLNPVDILADPVLMLTEDITRSRRTTDRSNKLARDTANWDTLTNNLLQAGRFVNSRQDKPFLDDTYRADDRWGPKPSYTDSLWIDEDTINVDATSNKKNGTLEPVKGEDRNGNGILDRRWNGEPISRSWPLTDERCNNCLPVRDDTAIGVSATALEEISLTRTLPEDPASEEDYGYDGYWERRAKDQGLRIIVGQRLELGNPYGWLNEDTDGDGTIVGDAGEDADNNQELDREPLYPPPPEATPGADGIFDTADDGIIKDDALADDKNQSAADESAMSARGNEVRQWKASRDNLASVQSTAVYHYLEENGNYPVTCMATTAHFGTQAVEQASRTFEYVDTDGDGQKDDKLNTDFLTGKGTNGMEFRAPFNGDASIFEREVNDRNSPLRIALSNLAYFAGDPAGAFPARQDSRDKDNTNDAAALANLNITPFFTPLSGKSLISQWVTYANDTLTKKYIGPVVHPYPYLTMWGDYSNLRRSIEILNTNEDWNFNGIKDTGEPDYDGDNKLDVIYANIAADGKQPDGTARSDWFPVSIADQTTLQTATCTIGMLAYNVDVKEKQYAVEEPLANRNVSLSIINTSSSNTADLRLDDFAKYVEENIGLSKTIALNLLATPPVGGIATADVGKITPAMLVTPTSYNPLTTCALLPGSFTSGSTAAAAKASYEGLDLSQWICSYIRAYALTETQAEDLISEVNTLRTTSISAEYNDNGDFFRSKRDRVNGFVPGLEVGAAINGVPFQLDVDPQMLLDTAGLPGTTLADDTDQARALALVIRGQVNLSDRPKPYYPSLFYLLPTVTREHDGRFSSALTSTDLWTAGGSEVVQTITSEPFVNRVTHPYIFARNIDGSGNHVGVNSIDFNKDGHIDTLFRPVEDGLGSCTAVGCTRSTSGSDKANDVVDSTEDLGKFVTYLGITPRETTAEWKTPVVTSNASPRLKINEVRMDTDKDGTYETSDIEWYPAFMDNVMLNGREMMTVRNLDIDLDLMRRTTFSSDVDGNGLITDGSSGTEDEKDYWLPLPTLVPAPNVTLGGAIIYAFREDAVREDAIARPRTIAPNFDTWLTNWLTYMNNTSTTGFPAGYSMNANSAAPSDSPVNPTNGISAKSVDFYADPDRRPYGFRLQNGIDLRRYNGTTFEHDDLRGMSFVTDNPLYTVGHFNVHSKDGTVTNRLEEFKTNLEDNWSNFYDRTDLQTATVCSTTTPCFAGVGDTWRPVELIADAVTVLSESWASNARSGSRSSSEGYFTPGMMLDDTSGGSFRGFMTVSDKTLSWVRMDGEATNLADNDSPIRISRRGFPLYCVDKTTGQDVNAVLKVDGATAKNLDKIKFDNGSGAQGPLLAVNNKIKVAGSNTTYTITAVPPVAPTDTEVEYTINPKLDQNISDNAQVTLLSDAGNCSGATRRQQEYSREKDVFNALNNPASSGFADNDPNSNRSYINWNDNRTLNGTSDTRIAYVMLQGLVPSRAKQAYGGLHNFPRFNEGWGKLYITGSMIQLNFSNYATGPFDQDAWEPAQVPQDAEQIKFYGAPTRLWGYDPALQYAIAGPVSRRFVTPGNRRSEFYRELASDDAYVTNLRCAKMPGGVDNVATPNTLEDRADPTVPKSLCQ